VPRDITACRTAGLLRILRKLLKVGQIFARSARQTRVTSRPSTFNLAARTVPSAIRKKKSPHDRFFAASACEKVTRKRSKNESKRNPQREKEKKMKIRMFIAFLPVALTLAGANQASAQTVTQQGPLGTIGWSVSAPLCTKVAGSAAIAIDYSAPSSVSFAPNAYGTVTLICNMPGIMNGLTWASINVLAFTFTNATAGLGCSAEVQLVDRTTATAIAHWATNPLIVYNGIWTAEVGSTRLPQNHTYDVEFRLHRPQSAVNSCHPAVYAGFLEWLIP
jgi:hypothetical protein